MHNSKSPCTNSHGVKGVRAYKFKWIAEIRVNNKAIYLGSYDSYEGAVLARKQAEIKYQKEI
ncbi:hypothetical protein ACI3PL_31630, partial [Lacticaseibacillus paracasei]